VYDVQVGIDEVEIQTGDTVQVEVGLDNVEVQTENSGLVDVEPNEYFLTSSGVYTGRLTGGIPIWLQNAIQQELSEGEGNITSVISDIRSLVSVLEVGVQQNTTSIQTTNQSLASLETSVVSRLDTNEAAILNVETTKVTANEAQTVALDVQKATFGTDAEAYITSLAATYTDQDSAVAQDIDLLVTTVDGVTASVTQLSTVAVDEGEARAKHSLVVNADNNISGYVAEAGTTSTFTILADQFKVANAATNFPVFTVDTTPGDEHVQFNSNVRVNGSLVVDETITVGKIPINELTTTVHIKTANQAINTQYYTSDITLPARSSITVSGGLGLYGTLTFITPDYDFLMGWGAGGVNRCEVDIVDSSNNFLADLEMYGEGTTAAGMIIPCVGGYSNDTDSDMIIKIGYFFPNPTIYIGAWSNRTHKLNISYTIQRR
jgi:hypothetical protein